MPNPLPALFALLPRCGVAAGFAGLVLAQASPGTDLSGWPSWIINGGVGALAIWAIMALITRHAATIEKLTVEFRAAIAAKDQQIIDQGKEFKEAVQTTHEENVGMLREMRAEAQKNIEAQFQLSREQVSALEHVTAGMNDLKNAVQTLAARVDEIDPRSPSAPSAPRRKPQPPT